MPNIIRSQPVYLFTGDPDTVNVASLYAPGELGVQFESNDKGYQIVQCDSGATAATPAGAVAANDLAFWVNKSPGVYRVTNDERFAIGGQTANAWRNQVAGIFRNAVTAGYYCCILKRGSNIAVKSDGNGGVGQTAVADGTAGASQVGTVAVGTASTYVPVGIMRGSASGGNINVDVNIPDTP